MRLRSAARRFLLGRLAINLGQQGSRAVKARIDLHRASCVQSCWLPQLVVRIGNRQ